jgi:hypothetical protein
MEGKWTNEAEKKQENTCSKNFGSDNSQVWWLG